MSDDDSSPQPDVEREPPELARKLFWASKRWAPEALRAMRQMRVRAFVEHARLQAVWQRCPLDIDVAPDVVIGRDIRVVLGDSRPVSLHIGPGCRLGDRVLLRFSGGSVRLGPRVELRNDVCLNVAGEGAVNMEGDDILSWGTVVHCAESVTLRRYCGIAEYVSVADSSHYYTQPDIWYYDNTATAPIVLGYNTWIAPKATITKGVTIGDYAIVGANSVVTRDVPEAFLAAGNPAAPLRPVDLPWRT